MARLIRTRCTLCTQDVDLKPDEFVITKKILVGEYAQYDPGEYVFSCPHCGARCEKITNPKIEQLLVTAGVLTVEELERWLVVELTGEPSEEG